MSKLHASMLNHTSKWTSKCQYHDDSFITDDGNNVLEQEI